MLALLALTAAGCRTVVPEAASPLQAAKMSPDSAVLELFFVRVPPGDREEAGLVWQDVDEQHVPAEVRRKLAENGFRVGLVAGPMPAPLARLMELTDAPPPNAEVGATRVENLAEDPRVVRRHLQLRMGRRGEILTSGIYAELPVLRCQGGQVSGQTYAKAQGLLGVKAYPEPDGRVRLELVPEVHYGDPVMRTVGDNGMYRLESGRQRCVLDDLTVAARLSPGYLLVLGSLPGRPGSLGRQFFSEDDGGRVQEKLLLVRLAQTQHDDLFAPPQ